MISPILFLHGAGSSDKNRAKYLQKILKAKGVPSLSFDFTGHGGIRSELAKSSLKDRVSESVKAVTNFGLNAPLNICGSSMGGYIAIKMLEKYDLANLILFCPAVYDKKAYDVNFGENFSYLIRMENSWKNSDAFEILENFRGNVLIVIGEEDEVIPKELMKMIDSSLKRVKCKEFIRIPNCPHTIHTWLNQNKTIATKIADKITHFVSSSS